MIWFIIALIYMAVSHWRTRTYMKGIGDQYSNAMLLCGNSMEHCAIVIDRLTQLIDGTPQPADTVDDERPRYSSTPIGISPIAHAREQLQLAGAAMREASNVIPLKRKDRS